MLARPRRRSRPACPSRPGLVAAALCVLGLLVGPVQASTNVFRLPADFSSQAGAAGFTCWYHLPSGDVLVPMVWDKFRPLERRPNAPRMWVGRDVPYLFINQDEARRWLLMAPGRQGEEPVITWKAPRTGRVAIWLAAKNATLCPPGPVPAARLRLTGGNGQPVAPDWPVGKRGSIPHIAEAVVEVLAGQSLRLWLSPKERSPCHRVGVQWSINYLDQGAAQTGPPPPARFVGGPASAKSGLTFWKGRLAWQEKTGRRQEEIRLLDLVGGGIQTLARGDVTAGPVLDGNRAAWALWDKTRKERPFYIVVAELASLASREVFAATRKLTHLALYGRWLAFAQRPQVTALNLADGRLARPPRGERTQSFPTLSGDTMAWDDGKDVFAMDLATGRARQVNPGNSGLCTRPDIWGHWSGLPPGPHQQHRRRRPG